MTAEEQFNKVEEGEVITGRPFTVTRDTIQAFADASLDYNPLHFDDNYMKNKFGKTSFDGVIMHGMQNFALITRTLTDWLVPRGGFHRRLETRWLKPVQLGHTITPVATLRNKKRTEKGYWLLFDVEVNNQDGMLVATGNAMAEFLDVIPGQRR
ncbi:phosphate acetyltransferase [Sneathiella chungangensis]|uniref:Phosphate acetyltransferase n=1 Tax=Sneathiella chungangensis TaxID=1418234 RepID=A0A845MMM8_9PROT|nr:MaoC family dehydratase [Sneathiella chungangensis]MZR24157.1 phosphate acetyltransferase [Sneathiella chungangensis]